MTSPEFQTAHLRDIVRSFRNYKSLAETAIAQLNDADLHTLIDPDANSIAVIVKHLAGNLQSRFSDFLTTDGEKPTRNRDDEFEMQTAASRAELMRRWDAAWGTTLSAVEGLAPADLERAVHIRSEAFLVVEALNRSVTHLAYHVGQIVFLAKHFRGTDWKSLSVPKGQSANLKTGTFKDGIVRG